MKNLKNETLKEYYIGMDIGTDSIGWAVTDTDYNLCKFRGNATWGIRLFDESNTAEERRAFRTSRRRTERAKQRIGLLESLFDSEISKDDKTFFMRFRESNLYLEDKKSGSSFSVFSDEGYTDKTFHKQFPTIYHLRLALMNDEAIVHEDDRYVRFVYIALHHIIKHRGHFLFDSLDTDGINDFSAVWKELCSYLSENYDVVIDCLSESELSDVLRNRQLVKTKKNTEIFRLCGITKKNKQEAAVLSSLSGSVVKLYDIFPDDESLKDAEVKSVSLSQGYDELETACSAVLGERFELLEKLKAVYDWALLADIMKDRDYISEAKVAIYEQHKADLSMLKKYVKDHIPEKYAEIFKESKSGLSNYVAYSGHIKTASKKTGVLMQTTNQEEFCKYIKKTLGTCTDERYSDMFDRIDNYTFMPKAVSKENAVIPMQVHGKELDAILAVAEKYLPFLKDSDENGSTSDKIRSVFRFRIPYYVGPLNKNSERAWLVRSPEKIYPWNFEKVVDMDASADKFIESLTSKCSYLPSCDVLPKCSLIYSRFMVLNKINNIRLNDMPISVELKQSLFNDLFMKKKKVTVKDLQGYFDSMGYKGYVITGIDVQGNLAENMKTAIELSEYPLSDDEKEQLVRLITIIGDDKKLKERRIRKDFGKKLTDEQIKTLSRLKYSGWGNLSRKFLTEIEGLIPDNDAGEAGSIMRSLWETNYNLMEIIHTDSFADAIKGERSFDGKISLREQLDEMYVSPKVKRPVYQSMQIIDEIVHCMGDVPPKKIFVEVARFEGEKGDKGRTKSRKTQLQALYNAAKKDFAEYITDDLIGQLENADDRLVTKRDRLYMYFAQLGRDLYTGDAISLNEVFNSTMFDIDHIWPQSVLKDDSMSNRVLVSKTYNEQVKKDIYPIPADVQDKMRPFWDVLHKMGLMTDKKYARLTRTAKLSDDEVKDFINRQMVETGQATKAVATLLTDKFKEDTEVVWVKAGDVSEFRHDYDMLKCRDVNDLHHAKDAYLNIVVGNVMNVLFNHMGAAKIKRERGFFNFKHKFDYFDIEGAWKKDETLARVKAVMQKNNVLYTRYAYKQTGALFKQQPLKKGSGQVPLKVNSPICNIEKYGGYDKPGSAYFAYVEYTEKKKRVRALIPVDLHVERNYTEDPIGFMKDKGLDSPVILIPCVKYNSCVSIDGFRIHISSKSGGGKTIVYKPAMQLVTGYVWEKYIRELVKYLAENKENPIDAGYFGITPEKNTELFDLLCRKMTETLLKVKFGDMGVKIISGRDRFLSISVDKQCAVLQQILYIMSCNVQLGDLKEIGGAGQAGAVTSNNKLTEIKGISRIELIHQSITGLYEQRVDLLKEPWDGER